MRELTKSMMRLSWAMSAFGVEQLRTMLDEDETDTEEDRSTRVSRSVDEVSAAMDDQLSERVRSVYEAGDRFGRELVDLMFDTMGGDDVSPRRLLDRAADMVERSADALRTRSDEEADAAAAGDDDPAPPPAAGD